MSLRVYNTLSRQKEPFTTVEPNKVGMYLCGPTVYKPSHVGHMVGPVIFDTVKRYLTYLGYGVTFVVNITDVDDKLIVQSREQNITMPELAERITADYRKQLERLGVDSIDHFPKATEHIDDIQRMITRLIDKGFAYLCGRAATSISMSPRTKITANFATAIPNNSKRGRGSKSAIANATPAISRSGKGPSPASRSGDRLWGPGRPGWHIECSAMSMKLLGQTLDIHGGGLDLQFPHHENELAQSESFTDKIFARYWMHNGLIKVAMPAKNVEEPGK